ncbi:MAG: winged helix DNA-binding protein [Candidatus Woesearchaeota archaeon]
MVRTKKIFNVFFREKPALMLIHLLQKNGEVYASSLAKTVDCTYSHVVKVLQDMQKAGLVTFEKRGRLKVLILTKKGVEVATMIDKINTTL